MIDFKILKTFTFEMQSQISFRNMVIYTHKRVFMANLGVILDGL